jgi:hypothetical protein
MDSKEKLKEDVGAVLETLHKKINLVKEKVDKLCENTECFGSLRPNNPDKQQTKN